MSKVIYKTAESVSLGHPDSLTDFIVNSILDAYLEQDPNSRVAIDGVFKGTILTLGGEITSEAIVDIPALVKKCVKSVGYTWEPQVVLHLYPQSPDIAQGTNDEVSGAGDQGTITGYACTGNHTNIPMEKALADELIRQLYFVQRKKFRYIKPDMKSQITIHKDEEGNTIIDKVVVAVQHSDTSSTKDLVFPVKTALQDTMAVFNIPYNNYKDAETIINGTGQFIIGGPEADSGEVGRKIVVDAYGVGVPVGGGTFNGKDCTKVDRSAAYMARYVAKSIVNANLADECLITVSYCIGLLDPISINYDFKGTNKVPEEAIIQACENIFSFRPKDIIQRLGLKSPMFATAGMIGHFGLLTKKSITSQLEITIPWEDTEKSSQELYEEVKSIIPEYWNEEED